MADTLMGVVVSSTVAVKNWALLIGFAAIALGLLLAAYRPGVGVTFENQSDEVVTAWPVVSQVSLANESGRLDPAPSGPEE